MEIEIHLDINNYRYSVLFIGHCFQCWKLGLLEDDLGGLVELSRHSICADAGQEACSQELGPLHQGAEHAHEVRRQGLVNKPIKNKCLFTRLDQD